VSKTHYTTCPLCEATCGIVVETGSSTIKSIRGDKRDPFSRGYICPKAAALQDLYEDPDRLREPVRRTARTWQKVSWDDALAEVAHKIPALQRAHGRDALAVYLGNPTVHNHGAVIFSQLFLSQFKTRNRYSATSSDQLPHMLAAYLMFGHQLLLPVPDLERTDFFFILGANPVVSNGSLLTAPDIRHRLQELRARGGRIVVADPRRTETAALADQHLFVRPGSDGLLLAAIAEALFAIPGAVDLGHLAQFTDGLERVRHAVRRFTAEQVAPQVGIAAGQIRQLAAQLAAAARPVVYGRVGICTQQFGGLNAWLINVLNVLIGALDRPGGAMFPTPAIDLVGAATRAGRTGSFGRWTSRVRQLPEFGGELPVATLADEITTAGPGQIRGLITSAGNPVLSAPSGDALDRALPQLEFMVSIDPYINETTRHAHLILPPTSPLERDHYNLIFAMLSIRNRARYGQAVFARAPEQRHDWEIFLELASRLGGRTSPAKRAGWAILRRLGARLGPSAVLDLALRTGPHKLSLRRLIDHPHGIDLGPLEPQLPERLATPTRRIDLAPAVYLADLERLARTAERPVAAGGELQLIGRRQLRSNNSWMHNSPRLVKGPERCTLLVHPDDAAARSLRDGAPVRVSSAAGTVVVPVAISDEVMPGVVSLPHGWGHRGPVELRVARDHAGTSANVLTDNKVVDPLSGNACFNGVPVTVEPASP
jgi:anaerobic selenocysteine-containing dehydrogenase